MGRGHNYKQGGTPQWVRDKAKAQQAKAQAEVSQQEIGEKVHPKELKRKRETVQV